MGFLETINEAARQTATEDDWYLSSQPYVLQLLSKADPRTGVTAGVGAYMVLPRGPEQYMVKRVMRQSITPTLGGLIAEERGLLWREISVSGSFGLEPKFSPDTSFDPDGPQVHPLGLSGPGWTRRMVRNFFEKYASLKSNLEFAAETQLIWHDLKTGDSWVVIPQDVTLDRNTTRRLQYPYQFTLCAIADAEAIRISPSPASLLAKVKNTLSEINAAGALIVSAVQEGSALLGEVRYYAASIDSIVSKLTDVVDATADFTNGVTDTLSIGSDFINTTTELLESTLILLETVDQLPAEVRQNYQLAADGLDTVAAQFGAFGESYGTAISPVTTAELGAARETREALTEAQTRGAPVSTAELAGNRVRSSDLAAVDAGQTASPRAVGGYSGTRPYVIGAADTLPAIAARFLGDGSLWYDLAVFNGLSSPYISETGAPGTVGVGDTIAVPVTNPTGNTAIAQTSGEPGLDRLGRDLELVETPESRPGRAVVDLVIDKASFRDFRLIEGVPNLAQAIQMRLWTERGTMPLLPGYGLPRAIGVRETGAFLSVLTVALRQTIRQDPRVLRISGVRREVVADVIEYDVDVVPIGFDTAQTISAAVV